MFDDGRYEKSAPGDFYVQLLETDKGHVCCWAGGAPYLSAPQFCRYEKVDEKDYCFVHKQPETDFEIYRMIQAAFYSEFECLRYAGTNPNILQRFSEIGLASVCDVDKNKSDSVLRNLCLAKFSHQIKLLELGELLSSFLLDNGGYKDSKKVTQIEVLSEDEIRFQYTWTAGEWRKKFKNYEDPIYHQIILKVVEDTDNQLMMFHSMDEKRIGGVGLTLNLDGFLRELEGVEDIRWYSEEEWNDGEPTFWRSTPY